jgi:hypothetical protein
LTAFFLSITTATATFAAGKYSKAVPTATVAPILGGSITLDVRNVAAGKSAAAGTAPNPDATRVTTTHSETLQINVGNLGTTPSNVTVRWFWVGRYATSGNWFRAAEGEKALAIDPRKSEIVLAEAGDVQEHDTRGAHEHYVSGGNRLGWVVSVVNSQGQIQAVKCSDSFLQGFAIQPPPKKRK